VDLLCQGPRTVKVLAEQAALSIANASQHLQARLTEVDHVVRTYVNDNRVKGTLVARPDVLLSRVRAKAVTILDVRPVEEYRAGHIPGALSMPLADLKKRMAELPKSHEIVAYCRGAHSPMAMEAVQILRKKGFRVLRLSEGASFGSGSAVSVRAACAGAAAGAASFAGARA
jgi:rhodanese-related sulfurtransferase